MLEVGSGMTPAAKRTNGLAALGTPEVGGRLSGMARILTQD